MDKQEALKKLDALEKEASELRKIIEQPEEGQWIPKKREPYWCVCSNGIIFKSNNYLDKYNKYYIATGNCFKTEEEAKDYKLRQLAREGRFMPKKGKKYYCWSFCDETFYEKKFDGKHYDTMSYEIGNVRKTKKEAEEWGKKFAKAFTNQFNK